jgi:serine/threonine protein kinase
MNKKNVDEKNVDAKNADEKSVEGKNVGYSISWIEYLPCTDFLKAGGSGAIYAIQGCPTEVYKFRSTRAVSVKTIEIEKRAYRRLGHHPNIVRCLGIVENGIRLERAEHCIREYFAAGGTATMEERIRWSRDIAIALQYVHDHGIRHADLGG